MFMYYSKRNEQEIEEASVDNLLDAQPVKSIENEKTHWHLIRKKLI